MTASLLPQTPPGQRVYRTLKVIARPNVAPEHTRHVSQKALERFVQPRREKPDGHKAVDLPREEWLGHSPHPVVRAEDTVAEAKTRAEYVRPAPLRQCRDCRSGPGCGGQFRHRNKNVKRCDACSPICWADVLTTKPKSGVRAWSNLQQRQRLASLDAPSTPPSVNES